MNWKAVVSGHTHFLMLKKDGSLWGWGDDRYMRLLGGGPLALYAVPQRLGTNSYWIDVALGQCANLRLAPRHDDGELPAVAGSPHEHSARREFTR